MPRATKAALDAPNVVALPGAAPRQVNNWRYAEQRRASFAARKASPFAEGYRPWYQREADALATELASIQQTPALLILSAMLNTMDADAARKVLEQLAPGAVTGSDPHRQAVAIITASRLNVGQRLDLFSAFDRMRKEGR